MMPIRFHFVVAIIIILLSILFTSCKEIQNSEQRVVSFTCNVDCSGFNDKEKVHQHFFSSDDTIHIKLGAGVNDVEGYKSKKSVLLTKKKPYGLTVRLKNHKLNEYYKVSAWRKDKSGKAAIVAQDQNTSILYEAKRKATRIEKDGWELIELDFEVPPNAGTISIFAFIAHADSAYFDQLIVSKHVKKNYPKYTNKESIKLYFTEKKLEKFEKSRQIAFQNGVHFNDGKWNNGILTEKGNVLPIKARFKGDWLDHLKGLKWSFRVKIRKGKTFKRLREFSLQTPASRYFLHEYLSHQLFLQEGLLTTRYDFMPLYFNKESRGIYALEEHFTKQLIEYNLRREGPILKFDEDPLWRNVSLNIAGNDASPWEATPNFEASRVLPFGKSKTLAVEKLKNQFLIGQGLLSQFKNRAAPVEEIFEIDKLAKFLAISDLHQGEHGFTWHNFRFYYNPISCKLEIINYDNFSESPEEKEVIPFIIKSTNKEVQNNYNNIFPYLFTSKQLVDKYFYFLKRYTSSEFINRFYDTQQEKVDEYLPLIQEEFPHYSIDKSYFLKNAKKLRAYFPEIIEKVNNGYFENHIIKDLKVDYSKSYRSKIFPHFLNAYYANANNKASLLLENFNNRAIQPIRLLDNKKKPLYSFIQAVKVNKFGEENNKAEIEIPYFTNAYYIEFKDLDSNNIHLTELTLWGKTIGLSPYQKLSRSKKADPAKIFRISNDTFLLSGKQHLKEKIIIPSGKTVIIKPGTNLDLTHQAAIVSYSPMYFKGTREEPILIHSSDQTANGIVTLQADRKSTIEYTTFSDLNTFSYQDWNLSGAVNFYESEVEIKHSTFQNNHCEDALNIIRTNFLVTHCTFEDIFADAFDADFCTGKLMHSSFDRVGNDAIDFSTSKINIESCAIRNINDKGISGGEGSTLWVKRTKIDNCNIGVASKDLSKVNLSDMEITNSKYGLVLLQKKPEYGPAQIEAEQLTINDCDEAFLIEKKSQVKLDGKVIKGTEEKVAESFY